MEEERRVANEIGKNLDRGIKRWCRRYEGGGSIKGVGRMRGRGALSVVSGGWRHE